MQCQGDTWVDDHHTVEDVGICLGQAFAQALGDLRGVERFGHSVLPMDEALILAAVDLSGRGMLCWDVPMPTEKVGTFDTELVKEFWLAFTRKAGCTLHLRKLAGENSHHLIEGVFKAAGRSLKQAVARTGRDERKSCMIAVIDYGVGNLFSLCRSLEAVGQTPVVTGDPAVLRRADKLFLPGVGAFADAAEKLRRTGLDRVIREEAAQGKPILGICLGMQLLFEESREFGTWQGLGLLPGKVVPMEGVVPQAYKIPHIGWNGLHFPAGRRHPLLAGVEEGDCVYFVHSFYAAECDDVVIATAEYGAQLTAAVARGNVMGCQFHPEKSGTVGLTILKTFCEGEW